MAARENYETHGKSKATDKSTEWSDWMWHDEGYYYSSRYNSAGEEEYRNYGQNQTPKDAQTPRFPALAPSYISTPHPSTSTYRTGNSDAYTTSTPSPYTATNSYYPPVSTAATKEPNSGIYYGHSSGASGSSNANWNDTTGGTSDTTNYTASSQKSNLYASPGKSYGDPGGLASSFANLNVRSPLTLATQEPYSIVSSAPRRETNTYEQTANTAGQSRQELNPGYRVEDVNNKRFWKVGRVFAVLWTEPARVVPQGVMSSHGSESQYVDTYLGGTAYSEIRRFVILQDGYGNCICSPIHTYNGQATLKPNLPETQEHAIIYTSNNPPDEYWYDYEGDVIKENLTKDPIRVRKHDPSTDCDLDVMSRLNYSKIYTVEKDLRVLNIGMVQNIPSLLASSHVNRKTPVGKPRPQSSRSDSKKDERKPKDKDRGKDNSRSKEKESGRRRTGR